MAPVVCLERVSPARTAPAEPPLYWRRWRIEAGRADRKMVVKVVRLPKRDMAQLPKVKRNMASVSGFVQLLCQSLGRPPPTLSVYPQFRRTEFPAREAGWLNFDRTSGRQPSSKVPYTLSITNLVLLLMAQTSQHVSRSVTNDTASRS